MKANDTIGAYKQIDINGDDKRILLASLHSDIKIVLSKIEYLKSLSYKSLVLDPFVSLKGSPFPELCYKFDTSQLVDFHEKLLIIEPIPVKRVKPLVINHGMLMITNARVYFQPIQINNVGETIQQFEIRKIRNFYSRRYLLRQIGLEFILNDGSSILFSFNNRGQRDQVYNIINGQLRDFGSNETLETMTRKWQRRELSNFEYITYLNTEADRSLNDLTQYPVFPHIIADYESSILDLTNPATFRDLSRPIGALNKQRLQHFKDRCRSMPPADPSLGIPPPFLYGTHYSTPGYILFYLVRVAPEFMLCLQNGKFDAPDRMFHSMREMWMSCLNNPADLKELIPEFFTGDGDWLTNSDDLDLGHRQTGERVNDVELPPWAKNPRDFIRKHAKALESDYVSKNLHNWIDLIFGYKQQGKAAVEADNLYYYLTYEGSIDLEQVINPVERNAYEMQIQEFGQTPKQLFVGPHPARDNLEAQLYIRDEAFKVLRPDSRLDQNSNSQNRLTLQKPTDSDQIQDIGIMHLDDDFRKEVAKELSSPNLTVLSNNNHGNNSDKQSFFPKAKEKASQIFGSWADKTTSFLDRSFNSIITSPMRKQDNSPVSTPKAQTAIREETSNNTTSNNNNNLNEKTATDQVGHPSTNSQNIKQPMKEEKVKTKVPVVEPPVVSLKSIPPYYQREVDELKLTGSEFFKLHKDSVTALSILTYGDTQSPFMVDSAVLATSSKDSSLKVVNITISQQRFDFAVKRTFSADAAFTSCAMSRDGKYLYASSLDNCLYHYSIQNANIVGKKQGHDDGISCIALEPKGKFIVTGSDDSTVKVFELKENTLPTKSLPPFYMDTPCVSISIDDSSQYVVAGCEDGTITVWDLHSMNVEFTYQLSQSSMMVSCVKWFPHGISHIFHNQGTFHGIKLVCSSIDGSVACLDATGRIFAGARFECGINALETDGRAIYGGLDDCSLRVWAIESGRLREVFRSSKAHNEPITSLRIDYLKGILASGAADGTVRLWHITT